MDGKVHYYPENLDNRYWLSYYSKILYFVEIDLERFLRCDGTAI